MEIKNENLKMDITVKMTNEEMIGVWHELEHLCDKLIISRESYLFKLTLAIKYNRIELYKVIDDFNSQKK